MPLDAPRNPTLSQITERLLNSYRGDRTINQPGHHRLPSTEAVIELVQDLKELLFPGYRRRQNLRPDNAVWQIGELAHGLFCKLSRQIPSVRYATRSTVPCQALRPGTTPSRSG